MRIYFATNRDPNNVQMPTDFGTHLSAQGSTDLRFGWAEFGETGDAYELTVAAEQLDVGLDKAMVGDLSGQTLGSDEVFQAVQNDMRTQSADCMIHIHGFDYTFHDALTRAADLKRFYSARPMVWFLFTWPSDGSLLPFKAYMSDRDDARASGTALGRGILKLADFLRGCTPQQYCGQSLHLSTHSMGAYALRWALQAIRANVGGNLQRLFEQVLLLAADEDDDSFEFDYKLKSLPDLARRVSVYCNPADRALMISDYTKGNPDRLGASGPRNARLLPDKVTVIDVEPVLKLGADLTGHQYYREDLHVKDDVLAALAGTAPQDIPDREYQPELRRYRLKR